MFSTIASEWCWPACGRDRSTRSHHVPSWDWEYASFVLHNSQVHQELLGYTTEDSAAFDNITVWQSHQSARGAIEWQSPRENIPNHGNHCWRSKLGDFSPIRHLNGLPEHCPSALPTRVGDGPVESLLVYCILLVSRSQAEIVRMPV